MSEEPYERPVVIVGVRIPVDQLLLLTLNMIFVQAVIGAVVYIVLRVIGVV